MIRSENSLQKYLLSVREKVLKKEQTYFETKFKAENREKSLKTFLGRSYSTAIEKKVLYKSYLDLCPLLSITVVYHS